MSIQRRAVEVATVPIGLSAKGALSLRARALFKSKLLMAEVDYGRHGIEQNADFPRWEDAFSIGVRYRTEVSETSVQGKRFDFRAAAGHTHILYLSGVDYVDFGTHRHSIEMVLTRAFVREIAEDLGVPAVTHLGNDACILVFDPAISDMAARIRPYFEDPASLDTLYADSFMWAFGIYVMRRYGHLAERRPIVGGLATWQERIAKELIEAHLAEDITLDELAACCGLRISQFSHAFRRSTGFPPYRWLILRRVSRAMNLIRFSGASLAEIATQCGFADQSHLTRVFRAETNLTPGRWRALTYASTVTA